MRCFTHHPFPHVPSLVLPWFSRPGVPVIRKSQIPPFQMCGQVPHFTSQSIRKILVVFFNFFNFRTKLSSYKFSYWWVEIFCNFFFGRTPLNNPRGYFGDFCHFNSSFFWFMVDLTTRIKATRCETLRTVKTNNSKKHSNLTYCLNVSFMVQKGTATIFSTSEPILLIVHENDLFWYVTTNI